MAVGALGATGFASAARQQHLGLPITSGFPEEAVRSHTPRRALAKPVAHNNSATLPRIVYSVGALLAMDLPARWTPPSPAARERGRVRAGPAFEFDLKWVRQHHSKKPSPRPSPGGRGRTRSHGCFNPNALARMVYSPDTLLAIDPPVPLDIALSRSAGEGTGEGRCLRSISTRNGCGSTGPKNLARAVTPSGHWGVRPQPARSRTPGRPSAARDSSRRSCRWRSPPSRFPAAWAPRA